MYSKQYSFYTYFLQHSCFVLFCCHIMKNIRQDDVDDNEVNEKKF